ncbi:hypothetical protein T4C_12649 [Trichinella pseudospiralis]|uniref:Uncharacterized protein n=1 Tax=Trichinella pseudospiralis TaxID=6337 RepID=A0A0V1JE08_TRIPS|nr:hypothetical protein T4C_12649 [Trichinella pseudospiralis]
MLIKISCFVPYLFRNSKDDQLCFRPLVVYRNQWLRQCNPCYTLLRSIDFAHFKNSQQHISSSTNKVTLATQHYIIYIFFQSNKNRFQFH